MNKRFAQLISIILLLIVIASSSGCTHSIIISSTQPKGTLVFSDFNNVYVIDFQSREIKPIYSGDRLLHGMAIANNLIYILCNTNDKDWGPFEIFKMNLDGTNLKQETFNGGKNNFPLAGNSNSNYLAYLNDNGSIAILDLDKKETRQIIPERDHSLNYPSLFPDGRELIYWDGSNSNQSGNGKLLLYSTADRTTKELLSDIFTQSLAWSSDGKEMLLNIWDGKQMGLYILSLENGGLNHLAINGDVYSFAWSPNENLVLYEIWNYYTDPSSKLYLYDLNNGLSKEIANVKIPDWRYYETWAPDGKYYSYFTTSESNLYQRQSQWTLNIQSADNNKNQKSEYSGISENLLALLNIYWINTRP